MHSLTVCCDSTFTYSLCVYNNLLKKELVYILIGYKPVLFLSIYIIFTIHINHSISLYCIHIFFHYLCIQCLYSIPYQLYILYIQAILLHQFTSNKKSFAPYDSANASCALIFIPLDSFLYFCFLSRLNLSRYPRYFSISNRTYICP